MATFIELTTDPFEKTFDGKVDDANRRRRAGASRVRRPNAGLEIKEDTHAIIKLIKSNGEEIRLVDSSDRSGESTQYANFILQSVSEARMEKHQIVDTFGEPYLFLFGEQPRFLDVTAVLVDSFDFNWYAEWWENYNRFLRGTRSVELGARTYMFYDDNIVEGYMLQAQTQKVSETPLMASLTFRLFLTNYSNVTLVTSNGAYPTRPGVTLPNITLQALPSGGASDPTTLSGALRAAQSSLGDTAGQLGLLQRLAQESGIDPLANALQTSRETVGGVSDFTGLVANTAGSVGSVLDAARGLFGSGRNDGGRSATTIRHSSR